jgi:hypothetical protein
MQWLSIAYRRHRPHILPVMQSLARDAVTGDRLPDPFGEPDVEATLPPSKPVAGFVGVAVFVALALLLLAARSLVG